MKQWGGLPMDHKKGFTLVELIITLAIASIILTGLVSVFSSIMKSSEREKRYVEIQDSVRILNVHFEKMIRTSSQNITVSESNGCYHIYDTVDMVDQSICRDGSELYVNDSLLVDNLKALEIYHMSNTIIFKGILNNSEEDFHYEKTIYLR